MSTMTGTDIRYKEGHGDNNTVGVLGCGPAGMLAAHAVDKMGYEPVIFSLHAEKSPMPGAIYLHEPIEGICSDEPDDFITVNKIGKREVYAQKVYGTPDARTSWDAYEDGEKRPAWSMKRAYDGLWQLYGDRIVPMDISADKVEELESEFPFLISTIPAPILCTEDHVFPSVPILINAGDGQTVINPTIVYNGSEAISWYRASYLFGSVAFEFGARAQSLPPDCVEGKKPLGNTCDCFPDVMRAGRFGKWERGVLVHHVFDEVRAGLTTAFEAL